MLMCLVCLLLAVPQNITNSLGQNQGQCSLATATDHFVCYPSSQEGPPPNRCRPPHSADVLLGTALNFAFLPTPPPSRSGHRDTLPLVADLFLGMSHLCLNQSLLLRPSFTTVWTRQLALAPFAFPISLMAGSSVAV